MLEKKREEKKKWRGNLCVCMPGYRGGRSPETSYEVHCAA